MKLGINQLLLLERAYHKRQEGITPQDVAIVYNMPIPSNEHTFRMQRQKQAIILRKLVLYGLLREHGNRFIITQKGIEILKNKLQQLRKYKWKKYEEVI